MPAVQIPVGGPTMQPTGQQQLKLQAIHKHGISDTRISGGSHQVVDPGALVSGGPRAPSNLPSPIGSFEQQGQPPTQRLVAVSPGEFLQVQPMNFVPLKSCMAQAHQLAH